MRTSPTMTMILVSLTLTACSSGMLRKEDVSASQTIEQFVENRFRDFEIKLPFSKAPSKQPKGPGEALHEAFFKPANTSQLARPVQNLKVFCEARGGVFSQIEPSRLSASKLATPIATKNDVFYGRRAGYTALGFDPQLAAQTAAYEATYYETFVNAYYPQSTRNVLDAAQRAGAFGKYGCERSGTPMWAALVEPVRYNPPSNADNLLDSPSLTLYIKATSLAQ